MPSMSGEYCCAMRRHFLIGIIAIAEAPTPIEAVDFIDFDQKTRDDRPIIKIKFCPFCGKQVHGPLRAV